MQSSLCSVMCGKGLYVLYLYRVSSSTGAHVLCLCIIVCFTCLAITRDLSSQKSPSTIPVDFSLRGPSDSLVVRSLSLKCTPQVVSTGSSVVVAQSLPTSDSVISCQIAKGVDSSSITTESAESGIFV